MQTSNALKPEITRDQMSLFLRAGWGDLGASVFTAWEKFNAEYFRDELKPCVISIAAAAPHGRLGYCSCEEGRAADHICLIAPKYFNVLVPDKNMLVHEMVHAVLAQRGDAPDHAKRPWMAEITRISTVMGRAISTDRILRGSNGKRKSVRLLRPANLPLPVASGWPRSIGIDLGRL